MNLSSTARKQDTDCLPPPGTHTGTRRQQQRIFSQTPGTPAVRVSGSSPENHGAKPTTPSCRQISVFRAEFSKPVFKTETYSFLASGESQLIHKEERKAEVPLRRRWFWSAGQLMSFVRAHQYLLSAVFYCIPILWCLKAASNTIYPNAHYYVFLQYGWGYLLLAAAPRCPFPRKHISGVWGWGAEPFHPSSPTPTPTPSLASVPLD